MSDSIKGLPQRKLQPQMELRELSEEQKNAISALSLNDNVEITVTGKVKGFNSNTWEKPASYSFTISLTDIKVKDKVKDAKTIKELDDVDNGND